MPLHVLQLGPYPPPEGGISRNMLAIRDELLARGDECTIVATSKSTRKSTDPRVHQPESTAGLLKLLASLRYDAIHLHLGGDLTWRVLGLALATAAFGRRRSLLSVHSGAFPLTEAARNASPRTLRGFIFRSFSRIIAVNENIAEVFRRFGVADSRVSVVLPFALGLPDPAVEIPGELASFCTEHEPLLLAVGGLEKDYDPLMQVAAMETILNEFPQAGLMIVGGGSMRGDVERAAAASGYADRILLAGNVDHAVTLHLINEADVFLRTTLFDGDAIAVREALFLGTPVIATDNGMRPEGICLIPVGDKNALIRGIAEIVTKGKPVRGQRMPDTANISAVLDLYDGLLRDP